MKKIIPELLFILLSVNIALAQNKKNDFVVNAGFSSGDGHAKPYLYGDDINTFNLNFEYYFSPLISAGLYGIYYHDSYKWESSTAVIYGYKDTWNGLNGGIKITLHAGSLLKINPRYIDLYFTAFGGVRNLSYKTTGINIVNIYADRLDYNIHSYSAGGITGIRFLFNRKFGVYTEVGMSRNLFINAGISFNLAKKQK